MPEHPPLLTATRTPCSGPSLLHDRAKVLDREIRQSERLRRDRLARRGFVIVMGVSFRHRAILPTLLW
jgi:hypothetical protein